MSRISRRRVKAPLPEFTISRPAVDPSAESSAHWSLIFDNIGNAPQPHPMVYRCPVNHRSITAGANPLQTTTTFATPPTLRIFRPGQAHFVCYASRSLRLTFANHVVGPRVNTREVIAADSFIRVLAISYPVSTCLSRLRRSPHHCGRQHTRYSVYILPIYSVCTVWLVSPLGLTSQNGRA